MLYSSKFVGEFQLQLEGEQELVHFTVRTLKVGSLSDQFSLVDQVLELWTLDKR